MSPRYLRPWSKSEACGWCTSSSDELSVNLNEFGEIDMHLCDDEDRIECERNGLCSKFTNADAMARVDFKKCRKVLLQNYTFFRELEQELSPLEKKKLRRQARRTLNLNTDYES